MKYLSVVSDQKIATASDGTRIVCTYMDHPRFNSSCALCAGLHYVFIRITPIRKYAQGYGLRTAIILFLDFVVDYEKKHGPKLILNRLTCIGINL